MVAIHQRNVRSQLFSAQNKVFVLIYRLEASGVELDLGQVQFIPDLSQKVKVLALDYGSGMFVHPDHVSVFYLQRYLIRGTYDVGEQFH
jgi:hypothetical protein